VFLQHVDTPTRQQILRVARGEQPADLVLAGGNVLNVFTGEIEPLDVAVVGSYIAGVGRYEASRRVDLAGAVVLPGLIDAHVHIESSLCTPAEFARAVVPRGVTAAVIDPHEIANVLGDAGVRLMHRLCADVPLDVCLMAPSCVPATNMATSGASLAAGQIESLFRDRIAWGLAEAMNFPGVVAGDRDMLAKIAASTGRPIDGHCPGLAGHALNAYVASGVGSDHESVSIEEAREKLSRGLYLLIREATNARNLDALLPLVTRHNARRICFCSDDRTPVDLLGVGSIDDMLRRAIRFGVDPIDAIRMATLNTAEWYGLHQIGAVAPGRIANLMIVDRLDDPHARMVYHHGALVAEGGRMLVARKPTTTRENSNTALPIDWTNVSFDVAARAPIIRVIGQRADQLLTDELHLSAKVVNGSVVADVGRDILKIATIDRHTGSNRTGLGFITGIGLSRGAIAGTVAHDHHNLVVVGADDASMRAACIAVGRMGGGLAIACDGVVVKTLALPIAGLMTDAPVEEVARQYDELRRTAREMGSPLSDPFMAMSFMALEVIPDLKLTDQGLIDVRRFARVSLFVDEAV
jgi:adenine deaminase